MEDAIADYDKLKKERSVKKGLLTRSVNKLRSVVSRGADAQADTVDSARCRARQMLEEIEEIHVQMETVLLEWDIGYEQDDEDATRPTARMADIDSNVQEIAAREAEVDKLKIEWSQGYATQQAKLPDALATVNADVLAKTVEALHIITDKLACNTASPSIRTTGMSPPRWDGQFKNFYSWRMQFEHYLKSAAIAKDEYMLMYVLHAAVLPTRVMSSIESCTSMGGVNGVWSRLEEKIPKAAVIQEIIADMEGIRPINQKTASEMRAVLDRLSDFARRITEIGNRSELYSPTVIRIVSSKLEPELYYECEWWMRYHHPTEELCVNRIVQFLRAETEARERLTPVRSARVEKPTYSLNHVSALTFTDPCILGCGVHHKFIDCIAFRSKRPYERRDVISRAGRCFSCFCRHRANDCPSTKHCSDCRGRHHNLWSAVAQLVECRARNRESPGSNPRCYRFEVWAFSFTSRRLSRLSCINEYLAIDSGGNVSE